MAFDEREYIKNFIENVAVTRGMPLPGRMPNAKDFRITLLPSCTTKASLWQEYCDISHSPCGLTSFKDLWRETVPEVKIMKPATDLCSTCQENTNLILRSANLSEATKQHRMAAAMEHLERARSQRDYYRNQCLRPLTDSNCTHISFDYAQQIHFPVNCQQVGPAFFKTPRKCQIFGVSNESLAQQVNYLIDESDVIGKGANSVVSMLHHYAQKYLEDKTEIMLHADNCCGQNKNNTNLRYWLWRTMTGLSSDVELSFMISGHTKFSPDRFFGLIKRKYNKSVVDTIFDIVKVVEQSSCQGLNIPQLTVDPYTSQRLVHWYAWDDLFKTLFRPLPGITSYHHFRMSGRELGVVYAREYCDSVEQRFELLKVDVEVIKNSGLPSPIVPPGMSVDRQWYLYEQIRSLCSSNLAGSITCPEPSIKKC
jgi:hypothetical protein